jgi:hypothetical protein
MLSKSGKRFATAHHEPNLTKMAPRQFVYRHCVHFFQPMFLGREGGVSNPLCLSSSSALHFCDYSFLVHHPLNWDDRHLLACAMVSDFSAAWQFFQPKSFLIVLVIDK